MFTIRAYSESDWPALWPILQETIRAGETYSYAPDSTAEQIHELWIRAPGATFVACAASGEVLGSYFVKANQPGLGSHVCNCGYIVASRARGQGIAAAMCEHSQVQARAMGFRAMQFNFVVSSNRRAVRVWESFGFEIVGRLPGAFHHPELGDVDALVMYRLL